MSEALKALLENIDQLSVEEKAVAAHRLLTSMESVSDDNVEAEWLNLAEERSAELTSGTVKGMSWNEIKKDLK